MKKTISLLLALMLVLMSVSAFGAFSDVDSNTMSWAGEAIDALEKDGIINGYEDGTFRPDGNVTRAEFAKMLCVAFECDEKSDADYTDISGHWAEEYILKTNDFVYTPSDVYNPDADATRAEISYALAICSGAEPDTGKYDPLSTEWGEDEAPAEEMTEIAYYTAGVLGRFSDADSIDAAMQYQVAVAVDFGFVRGYEDATIRGVASVTRAEAATLIFRVMNYLQESEDESAPETEPSEGDTADDGADVENVPESDGKTDTPEREEDGPGEDIYDKLLEQGHIYTLYPGKHLILVSSVTELYDDNGDEQYKLRYYIGGTGDEYESVIEGDTVVAGLRKSAGEIRSGDVMILDTAIWGKIGCLFVLSAPKIDGKFAAVYPDSEDWSKYPGDGEYEVFGGELLEVKSGSKSYTLTVQGSSSKEELVVPKSVGVDIYDVNSRRNGWENDVLSSLADSEDVCVFVRYTNGKASEVVAYLY